MNIKHNLTINKEFMQKCMQIKQNTNNYILICIIINLCIIICNLKLICINYIIINIIINCLYLYAN